MKIVPTYSLFVHTCFSESHILHRKSDRDALLISLGERNETAICPILETVDWNPEAVQGLEDSVLNSPQT